MVDKKWGFKRIYRLFTNIATKLTSELTAPNYDAQSYLTNKIHNSFYFNPTTPQEIREIINNLKNNGNGIHKISNSVLDFCQEFLSPIFSHLINICTSQGYFPHELKYGCITPLFKKGDRESVTNYRPVCAVSSFSKIIEKVIHNRMIDYLDKHHILSKSQFGYRKQYGDR